MVVKTFLVMLVLIFLVGCSSTNQDVIEIPSFLEATNVLCEDAKGECFGQREILLTNSDLLVGKTLSIYNCGVDEMCLTKYAPSIGVKEAYELIFIFQYFGILDYDTIMVNYKKSGSDIILISEKGDEFVIDRESGILYCLKQEGQELCYEVFFTVVDGFLILESGDSISCFIGNVYCSEGVLDKYFMRKGALLKNKI